MPDTNSASTLMRTQDGLEWVAASTPQPRGACGCVG